MHIEEIEYVDSKERVELYIPLDTDAELMILKSHLLMESLLDAFIYSRMDNPKKLKDARLTFHQKTILASAMCGEEEYDWLWNAISLLNKTRNKLVHNLDIGKAIPAILEFMEKANIPNELCKALPAEDVKGFRGMIICMHHALVEKIRY